MLSKTHNRMLNLTENDSKRFWNRVDKGEGNLSECWEWLGLKDEKGYGRFHSKNQTLISSRVAFFLHTGIINENLLVCHICDNTSCVNPDHLWLGTKAANNFDKSFKGRDAKGSMCSSAILNEKEVKEILVRLRNGESNVSIAKDYAVSDKTVSNIKHGRKWKHVTLS